MHISQTIHDTMYLCLWECQSQSSKQLERDFVMIKFPIKCQTKHLQQLVLSVATLFSAEHHVFPQH